MDSSRMRLESPNHDLRNGFRVSFKLFKTDLRHTAVDRGGDRSVGLRAVSPHEGEGPTRPVEGSRSAGVRAEHRRERYDEEEELNETARVALRQA